MIDRTLIDQAKSVALADLLAHRGHQPQTRQGDSLCYRSPLRTETTPSFWVNTRLNRWKDFGTEEKGDDVIRLVMRLDGLSFPDAVRLLADFAGLTPQPSSFLSGPTDGMNQPATAKETIRSVKLLENRHLVRYAEGRGIPYPLARTWFREVYYGKESRNLFALGFANDRDGYALRNGVGCKRNIGPAAVTTLPGQRPDVLNLFEGCFDFLSALVCFGQTTPTNRTVVLNSLTNLPGLLPTLADYRLINLYFDHDRAGANAGRSLADAGLPVADRSGLYADCKDLNEWLCRSTQRIEVSH